MQWQYREMTPECPQYIGSHQIECEIGEGAMGVVYKAYDPVLKRPVALKTLRRESLQGDSGKILARFKVEAEAAGRLIHSRIAAVHEFAEYQGTPFIVMEYAEGQTLETYFKNKTRFDLKMAVSILLQLLDALDFAHSHHVVHRDIKPGNIMITHQGEIKVMDFGVARIESSDLTEVGDVIGTPNYMSPEQWQGLTLDSRTDIFAVGVLLYQFLTGEKPFAGQDRNAVMYKTLHFDPPPPSKLNPQVPPIFDGIVQKALAKKPGDRFQTAIEFLEALRQAFGKHTDSDNDATVIPSEPRDQHEPRKHLVARGMLAGVAVLLVGGALWRMLPPSSGVGYLSVISDPAGAVVLLDNGQLLGVTPTSVQLSPGEYQIVLKKDGYHDLEASIEVRRAAEIPVAVTLNKIESGEN